MAIDDELIFSPKYTLNELQFRSEILNLFTTSLLASLVIANVGSIVSKLMYFTPQDTFNYQSWIRAVIFANTDDPLRLASWLRRKYAFHDRRWARSETALQVDRLFLPLLGRFTCVFASFVLVALSIPIEQVRPGCDLGDYELGWNLNQSAEYWDAPAKDCNPIPMSSRIGKPSSYVEVCGAIVEIMRKRTEHREGTLLHAQSQNSNTDLEVSVITPNHSWVILSSVRWRNSHSQEPVYYTEITHRDRLAILNISIKAVQSINTRCNVLERRPLNISSESNSVFALLSCNIFDSSIETKNVSLQYLRVIAAHLRLAAHFKSTQKAQYRIKRTKETETRTLECPILISVVQPVVNIVPLTILLGIVFSGNLLASLGTNGRSNAVDAGYHIVQESLGLSSAANPLEKSEGEEVRSLPLRKWRCKGDGRGHIGFIGHPGDVPVAEFEEPTVIGGCRKDAVDVAGSSAASEHTRSNS